jgi:hypothetical protein
MPSVVGWLVVLFYGGAIGQLGIAQGFPLLISGLMIWVVLDRSRRYLLMFGYFLGATTGIPEAIHIYNDTSLLNGYLGYLGQALILSLPFLLFVRFRWGLVAGSLLLLLSPIGWINPLIIAGALFPDTGFVGLLATIIIALWYRNVLLIVALLLTSALLNASYLSLNKTVYASDLTIINTHYTQTIDNRTNHVERSELALLNIPDKSPYGKKILLPETHFLENDAFEKSLPFLEQSTLDSGATIIAGLYSVNDNENTLVVIKDGGTYVYPIQANALVPSPSNPFVNLGPSWHLTEDPAQVGSDLLIVCFEEYHLGVFLWKMINAHDIERVIGFENLWWSNQQQNSMVAIQRLYARLAARLFGLPYQFVFNG